MDDDIQLISDGDGLAVIGNAAGVEHFLAAEGLASRDLGLHRLKFFVGTGAVVAQAGSEIAANSGRWVKLTRESAGLVEKYGLRESSKTGLSTGVLKGKKGQVKGFIEFVKKPQSLLTNPAILAGAAGIMAQVAMQQTMDEITSYLATIDAKVDDVLRAQKDAVHARMIGVGLIVEETLIIREQRGRVDEVTWSKVQTAPAAIAETQVYALRQLEALADMVEARTNIGDLAVTAKEAAPAVREWLAVLARCVQLQDAIAILELDRILDASPEELDGHRIGLRAARQARMQHISRNTERLVARMNAAAHAANAKVLLHPAKSPAVVQSSNQIAIGVHDFHVWLGIESDYQPREGRRWAEAAIEAKDKAIETGAKGVEAVRGFGGEALDRAGLVTGKLSSEIADRTRRWRGGAQE